MIDPTWLTIAERFGVPVFCLVALAWAVWRLGKYALTHIAKPLAVHHIAYLDKASNAMESQAGTLVELSGNMERMAASMEKMEGKVDSLEVKHQMLWTEVKGMSVKADKVVVMPKKDGE